MGRLAVRIAVVGAFWLLIGAVPVLADGGPHVATINNGTGGITADSCAGCHRAHTAEAPGLLVTEQPAMCLACHGDSATGATTDVYNGVQYTVSTNANEVRGGAILGALRAGGFVNARIDSGDPGKLVYALPHGTDAVVPVLSSGQPVTSTHMNITDPQEAVVWGNGDISATDNPGGTTTLTCTSCHNPHGNGQYRILNPIPTGTDGTMVAASADANVDDAPLPSPGDARNYTVIQKQGTEGIPSTYLLYASDVVAGGYDATVGDYFHKTVPWNATSGGTADAPNGEPSTFNGQITAWCAQCHTRYLTDPAVSLPQFYDTGDSIFTYEHGTTRTACTTCHVVHGSNAQMPGVYSANETYPGGAVAPVGDSRLLKIDNRGTCQACHDPTGTLPAGTYIGPVPTPVAP